MDVIFRCLTCGIDGPMPQSKYDALWDHLEKVHGITLSPEDDKMACDQTHIDHYDDFRHYNNWITGENVFEYTARKVTWQIVFMHEPKCDHLVGYAETTPYTDHIRLSEVNKWMKPNLSTFVRFEFCPDCGAKIPNFPKLWAELEDA